MVLGLFFPGNSFMHNINPISKIIVSLVFITSLFLLTKLVLFVPILVLMILIAGLSQIPLTNLFRSLRPIIYLTFITFFANLFLSSGRVIFDAGIFTITDNGLYNAILLSIRLIFITFFTTIISYTTSPLCLATSIEKILSPLKKIGLPVHEIGMIITIALRFIPTLIDETDKIIKAQKARGGDIESNNLFKKIRAFIMLFTPIFFNIFKRADQLAVAMECRGYRGSEDRTQFRVLIFNKTDIIFTLTICGLLIRLLFF